ncbi:MAG: hypothetical protein QOG59_803 [Solirubrobacteraceae bacterium]|nr:hypothetical protein [Solirubrobacteraceae bacterium]
MTLQVRLERPLPATLPAGQGTAVVCAGTCVHDRESIAGLEVLVGEETIPVRDFGMWRSDVASALGSADGRLAHSGFWVIAPVLAQSEPGLLAVTLSARLPGGGGETTELGRIEITGPAPPAVTQATPERSGAGLIAVCMATFEPDMDLFRAQVRSLREQTDRRWICLISDDASNPESFAQLESELARDPRFAVSRAPERAGFYRNFERALTMVPPEADLIALCDQDDRWYPDKLETLRNALGEAVLAYSDLRLVEADGRVLRDTLWRGRANNDRNLASMLIANTITGAATLFRRDLLDVILPFPDTPGFQFHDHWLALAALASGDLAYVERPLYDYVQHRGAVFGHVTHGGHQATDHAGALARGWRFVRGLTLSGRAAYFYGYLPRQAQAQALLVRCVERLTPAKRAALERFVAADRSALALAWLAVRPARMVRGHTETLASETELVRGLVWERLARQGARRGLPALTRLDASPPAPEAFSQKRLRRWRARIGSE